MNDNFDIDYIDTSKKVSKFSLLKKMLSFAKPYKYLILSKRNFLEPEELIELFKFNRFNYISHKNILFETISYQIVSK